MRINRMRKGNSDWWSLGERLENFCFDVLVGLKFLPTGYLPPTTCLTCLTRQETRGERLENSGT